MGSVNNLIHTIICLAIIQVCDVNGFWVKFVLWIPPPHPFNIFRLMFFWLLGSGSLEEYHAFAIEKKAAAPGILSFLCALCLAIELVMTWNYRAGMFPVANATFIWRLWVFAGIGFSLWAWNFFRAGDHIRYGGRLTPRRVYQLVAAVGPFAVLLFFKGCPLLSTTSRCVFNKGADVNIYNAGTGFPGIHNRVPDDDCFGGIFDFSVGPLFG